MWMVKVQLLPRCIYWFHLWSIHGDIESGVTVYALLLESVETVFDGVELNGKSWSRVQIPMDDCVFDPSDSHMIPLHPNVNCWFHLCPI